MFNTVSGKKIAILGFAFKKDTGDTRETPALTVVDRLLEEGAQVAIYDPIVEPATIFRDLDRHTGRRPSSGQHQVSVQVCKSAQEATRSAHAIVICTEWDQFRQLDYAAIYEAMEKPAFLFDGRLIVDEPGLRAIGFQVFSIGKAPTCPDPIAHLKQQLNGQKSTSSQSSSRRAESPLIDLAN